MKTFYFLKSHKIIVFGLIFSFCLCFIRPVSSFADDSFPGEYTFGCIDMSGQRYEVSNDQPLNLFQLINGGADRILSTTYNQNFLNTAIRSIGLGDYFYNWDIYNPLFYVNVYESEPANGYVRVHLDFRKSNFSDLSFSYLVMSDRVLFSQALSFPCIRPDPSSGWAKQLFSLPKNFYCGLDNYVGDKFYFLTYPFNSSTTLSYGGISYPASMVNSNTVLDLSSVLSSFLSNDDYYSLTVKFTYSNSNGNIVSTSYGFNVGTMFEPLYSVECLLSTFFVYNFDDNIEYSSNQDGFGSWLRISLPLDFNFSNLYDLMSPYTVGLTWDLNNVIPTPTPIPSPEWITPTPMPTVTPVPVTLTPIPQYINPDLDIDSTEVKSALSGYLDIIDDTFSNFAIFALGSQVLSYLYSFSSYFSFVLLIPAICLIAYAIGRLNQK